jgi:16S rRNA (guanine966-N2)-methyltransferase
MPARSPRRRAPRTLRIIAGQWRGRRLTFPHVTDVRPTPDRVRETVFNWLRDRIHGARCLDLYAGSGLLGFEALSRGAREVCFVESEPLLAAALAGHAQTLGADVDVVNRRAEVFLDGAGDRRFDIAFVDPPFSLPLEPIIARLPAVLDDGAVIFVERDARDGLPAALEGEWLRTGRAGRVCFGLATLGGSPADLCARPGLQ